MKVAIVHDWLVTPGGAEKVLEEIFSSFPHADLYTLIDFMPRADSGYLSKVRVTTSFIQHLPFAQKRYRHYLPFMPLAVEQFDLSTYDVVITSSHAIAKGVIVGPDQLHICYCHSPIRYAWDMQHQYLRDSGLDQGFQGLITRWLLHKIRIWDTRTSNSVDHFIANSHFIERRIKKAYRRNSTVIYPPVNTDRFRFVENKDNYYVVASRMVQYKKIPLIIEAFNRMPSRNLVVIGDGPDFDECKKIANNNIKILGWQPNSELVMAMQNAKAFVYIAEEDFGISPIEAQACGTPVIAYGKGGLAETIIDVSKDMPTGILYADQNVDSLISAVEKFEKYSHLIRPENCRKNSERFSAERFNSEFKGFVIRKYSEFQNELLTSGYAT